MSIFLDTLKQRWVEAHQRYKEAVEALAAANARHTTALAENNNWQKAYELEKAREEAAAALAAADTPAVTGELTVTEESDKVTAIAESVTTEITKNEGNKTEMIRDLLRQHPGMTPSDLWNAAKAEITNRPYVYSILKRLKDRDQVSVRRGKYYLRLPSKPEEGKSQITVQ